MELSEVNSRESAHPGGHKLQPAKGAARVQQLLARESAALAQLAKIANSQNLRAIMHIKSNVFMLLRMVARLHQ